MATSLNCLAGWYDEITHKHSCFHMMTRGLLFGPLTTQSVDFQDPFTTFRSLTNSYYEATLVSWMLFNIVLMSYEEPSLKQMDALKSIHTVLH